MSKGWQYSPGEWRLICDVCGIKYKSSESKFRWDGLITCPKCFEHRHPQDYLKARPDKITVPFLRPIATEVFVELSCNLVTGSGFADYGTADCARADMTYGMTIAELIQYAYCTYDKKTGVAGVGYAGCMVPMFNADAYL